MFAPRESALEPTAVVATGPAAALLARSLLASEERLAGLQVVVGERLLCAIGPAALLPWCDGAVYLAAEAVAPALLLPTTLRTTHHPMLLYRATGASGRVALLADGSVLALDAACRVSPARLTDWVKEQA